MVGKGAQRGSDVFTIRNLVWLLLGRDLAYTEDGGSGFRIH